MYPCDNLLDAFLVRFHIKEGLDLAESEVLPVTHSDEFIEGAEQLKCIAQNLPFVQALADASNNLGEQVKRINVLQNVGLAVGDEDHVKLIQGLVYEADVVLLDCCVLIAAILKFRKRSKKTLNPGSLHISELAREYGLAAPCAY